jgi:hypothetical protein
MHLFLLVIVDNYNTSLKLQMYIMDFKIYLKFFSSRKLDIVLPEDPAIPLLGIYQEIYFLTDRLIVCVCVCSVYVCMCIVYVCVCRCCFISM